MLQEPNNDLTDDERCGERQLLFGNSTSNIESIPVCYGGTPIHVTEVALSDIEVAVHQDDSSSMPNTKQPESPGHRISGS